MKKPVLVVMAAGMGSRYGGLKQIDPVGNHGQLIIDYSIYDAKRAGFETVVFVIKHEIEDTFHAGHRRPALQGHRREVRLSAARRPARRLLRPRGPREALGHLPRRPGRPERG